MSIRRCPRDFYIIDFIVITSNFSHYICCAWSCIYVRLGTSAHLKPVFHLTNLFTRREAKTRIRLRDWLTLVAEKIRRGQVGTVPTFFCSREQFRQVENGLNCFVGYAIKPWLKNTLLFLYYRFNKRS